MKFLRTWTIAVACAASVAPTLAFESTPKPTAKQDVAGQQPREPEDVLRAFLLAMLAQDERGIRALMIQNERGIVLWRDEPIPEEHIENAKKQIQDVKFRRVKVGESIDIPGQGPVEHTAEMINDNRVVLTAPGYPIPFIVVRAGKEWKVDAGPLISARFQARNTKTTRQQKWDQRKRNEWVAQSDAAKQLDAEIEISPGLKLRPPAGYDLQQAGNDAGKSLTCRGPMRDDNSGSIFQVIVATLPEEDTKDLQTSPRFADDYLAKFQRSIRFPVEWHEPKIDRGTIAGAEFTRVQFSATAPKSQKMLYGWFYFGVVDGKLVIMSTTDLEPHEQEAFPILEASTLSLRREP